MEPSRADCWRKGSVFRDDAAFELGSMIRWSSLADGLLRLFGPHD